MSNQIQLGGELVNTYDNELGVHLAAGTVTVGGTASVHVTGGTVDISSLPDVAGTVVVSSIPDVAGTVVVSSASAVAVTSLPDVAGTVVVSSLPDVAGTVVVSSLPDVAGTVNVAGTTITSEILPSTITLYNIDITDPDTEYYQALPETCLGLAFRCRNAQALRYAFAPDIVATGTVSPFSTLRASTDFVKSDIRLPGGTLYLASSAGTVVAEIEAWS